MSRVDDEGSAWEYYGKHDPYWGVLTSDEYHAENITEEAKRVFFETGREYIENVLSAVRRHLDPGFSPKRAVDFGCGVGRLLIPLAMICDEATGVDVSDAMLQEAARNVGQRGLSNVTLVKSDDDLSRLTGRFDFINSYIVFQHIPRRRGEAIFSRLVDRLDEGGVGALHITYWRKSSPIRNLIHWARTSVPFFNGLVNLVILKKPFGYPMMQMNEYDLRRLFSLLQDRNCLQLHVFLSRQVASETSSYSVTLLFQKKGATKP